MYRTPRPSVGRSRAPCNKSAHTHTPTPHTHTHTALRRAIAADRAGFVAALDVAVEGASAADGGKSDGGKSKKSKKRKSSKASSRGGKSKKSKRATSSPSSSESGADNPAFLDRYWSLIYNPIVIISSSDCRHHFHWRHRHRHHLQRHRHHFQIYICVW